MAGRLLGLPAAAGLIDRLGVMAVEQVDAALVTFERSGHGAIDQEADPRAIGVVVAGGQEDRLVGRVGVAGRRMGEKALIAPGPQQAVQRLDAFRPELLMISAGFER